MTSGVGIRLYFGIKLKTLLFLIADALISPIVISNGALRHFETQRDGSGDEKSLSSHNHARLLYKSFQEAQ